MNKLKEFRQAKRMSQIELAHSVGLKWHSFISNCETGEKRLPYDLAVKIANVLDCDVLDLMGDDVFKKGVEINKDASKSIADYQNKEPIKKPIKEKLIVQSYRPVSFKEANRLVKEKFGVELIKEIYDFLVEIWRKEDDE